MRLPIFFAAPHRVMFLSGTVQALLVMAFWSLELGGRSVGFQIAPVWPLFSLFPPFLLHALLVSCGVFPLFIFGFILTAGPRWQGAGELSQRDFLPAFALLASGWLLVWTALIVPLLLIPGLALVLAGWSIVALILTRLARARTVEREHIVYVTIACWLGAAGLGAFLVFAAGAGIFWARLGMSLAVWGFLLPVFLSVTHRMLPFFTASALLGYQPRRPAWALRMLLGLSLTHGALTLLDMRQWLWLVDFPAALVAARLSLMWWHRSAIANRLLAVLHIAFAWLAPAFVLFGIQSLAHGMAPGLLGQAPLHALAIGFFASMLLGMASRVTMGHSGKPVTADEVMWKVFCVMQAAALLRVLGDLPFLPGATYLIWLSSLLWLGAFSGWAWRYAPAFWRPRTDGRPG